jgi:tetratricopeptide (TPR) repeat protein
MTATSRLQVVAMAFLAMVVLSIRVEGQLDALASPGRAAQAKSQEELDSYLEIVTEKDPLAIVLKVKSFSSAFPNSELLSAAYQLQLQAFELLNDFEGMLAAGEKALAGNADNLDTLLALAPAMASRAATRPDRVQLLAGAEAYAHRALDKIDTIRIPRKLALEQWNTQKKEMQSEAHGVLGVVAFQRGQFEQAINELERAISLSPKPEGVQFLRLGLALTAAGKKGNAEEKLRRAAELGPDSVHNLAVDQLKKLNDGGASAR